MPPKRNKLSVLKKDDKSDSETETTNVPVENENGFHRKTREENLELEQCESQDECEEPHSPTDDEHVDHDERIEGKRGGYAGRGGGRRPPMRKHPASSLDFNYAEILEKYPTLATISFEEIVKYLVARTFTEKKFGFCSQFKTMIQAMNGEIERPQSATPSVYRGRGNGNFGRYNRYRGSR